MIFFFFFGMSLDVWIICWLDILIFLFGGFFFCALRFYYLFLGTKHQKGLMLVLIYFPEAFSATKQRKLHVITQRTNKIIANPVHTFIRFANFGGWKPFALVSSLVFKNIYIFLFLINFNILFFCHLWSFVSHLIKCFCSNL